MMTTLTYAGATGAFIAEKPILGTGPSIGGSIFVLMDRCTSVTSPDGGPRQSGSRSAPPAPMSPGPDLPSGFGAARNSLSGAHLVG